MSRSSVVWGPFSIVWGLAIAMVTQLLYRYKGQARQLAVRHGHAAGRCV